ncbi:MAG: hypothetical protein KDA42_07900 [Planctomycetales bacterium]|nr:hypothetical protein [Planctomycetales bacterium]
MHPAVHTCRIPFLSILLLAFITFSARAAEQLPVFILAGQSNMEGKAKVVLLEHQIQAPETKALFAHLHENGKFVERDDVFIKFLDRHGKLTVGYGSRNCVGPELEFGNTVGDHFDEPVLIIKTAWGGKSLFRDFRPPSAGDPPAELFTAELERYRKRDPNFSEADLHELYGKYYREMIAEVKATLAQRDELFPELAGRTPELAGFVWFQGWNDMINADYTAAYAEIMAHFIRDVRKDLDAPKLPFVIGQLGVGGDKDNENAKKQTFKTAQAAAAELPEFAGNVAVVKTDQYWDWEAQAVFDKGWKQNLEAWNRVGSDYPYHYLGSHKCYGRIGKAFGEAILRLQK